MTCERAIHSVAMFAMREGAAGLACVWRGQITGAALDWRLRHSTATRPTPRCVGPNAAALVWQKACVLFGANDPARLPG